MGVKQTWRDSTDTWRVCARVASWQFTRRADWRNWTREFTNSPTGAQQTIAVAMTQLLLLLRGHRSLSTGLATHILITLFLHMTKSMCIAVQLSKFFFHYSQLHNERLLEKSQNPREIRTCSLPIARHKCWPLCHRDVIEQSWTVEYIRMRLK